jgi:hypothetical protein
MHGRLLVLAFLVYLALDLSVAALPGIFAFDLAESAESTQVRARVAPEDVAPLPPARDPGIARQPGQAKAGLASPSGAAPRPWVGRVIRLSARGAPHDVPAGSEDPH